MISSTVWARLILPSAMLHSVNSVAPCCRVAWYCSGARRVVYSANSALQCTVATCQTCLSRVVEPFHTVATHCKHATVCAVLAQSCHPPAHTSCYHLMGRVLHALQVRGAALVS
jgi:hypothetical protein